MWNQYQVQSLVQRSSIKAGRIQVQPSLEYLRNKCFKTTKHNSHESCLCVDMTNLLGIVYLVRT